MGMNIMSYRATLAGGELLVEEPAKAGPAISCLIPRARKEANELRRLTNPSAAS